MVALEAEKHALEQQLERMLLAQQAVVVASSEPSLSSHDSAHSAAAQRSPARLPSADTADQEDDEHTGDSDSDAEADADAGGDLSRRHRESRFERKLALARRAAELDERAAAVGRQSDALAARAADLEQSGTNRALLLRGESIIAFNS